MPLAQHEFVCQASNALYHVGEQFDEYVQGQALVNMVINLRVP
jgi:hypothetical protein